MSCCHLSSSDLPDGLLTCLNSRGCQGPRDTQSEAEAHLWAGRNFPHSTGPGEGRGQRSNPLCAWSSPHCTPKHTRAQDGLASLSTHCQSWAFEDGTSCAYLATWHQAGTWNTTRARYVWRVNEWAREKGGGEVNTLNSKTPSARPCRAFSASWSDISPLSLLGVP